METASDIEKIKPSPQLVAAHARSKQAWIRLWLRLTSIDPDDLVRLLPDEPLPSRPRYWAS